MLPNIFFLVLLQAAADPAAGGTQGVRIAGGESILVQPFSAGAQTDTLRVATTWTLWRTGAADGYEVREETVTTWDSPAIAPRRRTSRILLSPDLHAVGVRTVENGGVSLSCTFGERLAECTIGGQHVSLDIRQPYDFYGSSAWFFASIVRRAPRETGRVTEVRLVLVDNPPGMGAFNGKVRYLGEEDLVIDGRSIPAHRYELDARYEAGMPVYDVWVSREGIPLRNSSRGQPGEKLVRLRMFTGF